MMIRQRCRAAVLLCTRCARLTSSLFSSRNSLGSIYNFTALAPMLSSLILGSKLPAAIYGHQAAINHTGNMCYGASCYRAAFITNAALLGVSALLALVLIRHSRRPEDRSSNRFVTGPAGHDSS